MELGDYLKEQHMDYCYTHKEMISEKEWINEVLNSQLSQGEKLRYPSMNQWMNNERLPDVRNMVKLLKVFGPEVLLHLSVEFPRDLAAVIGRWNTTSDDDKERILEIVSKKSPELATLQT